MEHDGGGASRRWSSTSVPDADEDAESLDRDPLGDGEGDPVDAGAGVEDRGRPSGAPRGRLAGLRALVGGVVNRLVSGGR